MFCVKLRFAQRKHCAQLLYKICIIIAYFKVSIEHYQCALLTLHFALHNVCILKQQLHAWE